MSRHIPFLKSAVVAIKEYMF
jgi:hypothetical protein